MYFYAFATAFSIFLTESEKRYIRQIILSEYSTATSLFIYPQAPVSAEFAKDPPVLLWDPLTLFKDHNYLCKEHKNTVTASYWMDGSTTSRLPRLLHDTQGPTLLVGRNYRCSAGNHYIRSTDSDLFLHYSQLMDVPFKLTHAQAFTITFLKDLLNAINNGISFNRFQTIY